MKLQDRFFAWFNRKRHGGRISALSDSAHDELVRGEISWNTFCDWMERAYAAGYRAGKRANRP